jgi:subtilisin-like proprotein convertase family protein
LAAKILKSTGTKSRKMNEAPLALAVSGGSPPVFAVRVSVSIRMAARGSVDLHVELIAPVILITAPY